jgi:hypothetical protein
MAEIPFQEKAYVKVEGESTLPHLLYNKLNFINPTFENKFI